MMSFIITCSDALFSISQPDKLENAVCHQYGVKDVKILGHGNINHLMSRSEKHKQQHHVCYEVAYVAKAGYV